ncbi:MAG: hypothetical protein ACP5NP_17565, partial [Acetobacteraceae bacterium]
GGGADRAAVGGGGGVAGGVAPKCGVVSCAIPRTILCEVLKRHLIAMARADKTLAAMRANPRDWRIASLETVALAFGVRVRKPGGSHVVFEHPSVA